MKKIILDLCGGTGSWSKPWAEAGYEVINVTLPEYDVKTYKIPDKPIYGIFASPPCKMFSFARTTAKTPRDFNKSMEVVKACLNIIWAARAKRKLAFWAIENPQGLMRQFLGRPAYTFQPYDFGDRYSKETDIWGYFNIPKKEPVKLTKKELHDSRVNIRVLPNLPKGYKVVEGTNRAARRAITPVGFAKAFFEANKERIKIP
jgi:hypothetical protein